MYRIGICDDEMKTCAEIEEFVNICLKNYKIKGEIEIFYSGEYLIHYLKQEKKFDILFLDIELEGIDGVSIGRFVRENLGDELMDIVYVSSKKHYAMQLFQCRPLDFLVKPLACEDIERVLRAMVKRRGIRKGTFVYKQNYSVQRILVEEIMYFRSDNKKIDIVVRQGEAIRFAGKLIEVSERVPDHLFVQIHKSYLINLDYVSRYASDYVEMINGEILSISKANRKDVKRKFMEYEMM